MMNKLSLIMVLFSMSFSMTAIAGLDIDLTGLDEVHKPVEREHKSQKRTYDSKEVPDKISGNGRYRASSSISSSVYFSQGSATSQRRNVELVVPKKINLVLPEPASLLSDNVLATEQSSELTPSIDLEERTDESMLSFIDEWLGIDPVKSWEKGTLADKAMKPGGVVPEFDRFSEKVFSYKQGSVGGSGVGGGGCGCN